MKTVYVIQMIFAVLLIGFCTSAYCQTEQDKQMYPLVPDEEVPADVNYVYSPALRASWTVLVNDILNEAVKLNESLPLVDKLNKALYPVRDNSNMLTAAGYIEKGIIDSIDQLMSSRFGYTAGGLEEFKHQKEGILCYSYFSWESMFPQSFEELEWNFSSKWNTIAVKCFGISKGNTGIKNKLREQVTIYDYQGKDNFILRLECDDPSYEVIIAVIPPESSPSLAVKKINRRIKNSFSEKLSHEDELIIPLVRLKEKMSLIELEGKYLANTGFTDYFIAAARSEIELVMDKTGVRAQATGKIFLKKGPAPRIYAVDGPYYIMLREEGSSEPDLLIWLNDTRYLIPL